MEQAPPKLYMLAALLIREGFIAMDDLYLHVCRIIPLLLFSVLRMITAGTHGRRHVRI
jgi:hypothetical protein